jgi:hypothetical protein
MKSIADALVFAVYYINCRTYEKGDELYADDDVRALESIAGYLAEASRSEQEALAEAAERAIAAVSVSHRLGGEYDGDLSRWMQDMFGEEWEGNRRVSLP